MKEVKTIKPFTRFLMTIGELPSSYLVSMTYEEQLLWFCNFLQNTVIPTINNNSEAVIELQEFVANYFDNLDVQEEINNKLDDMAESGELAEIIAEYLQLAALFCYDTIADMAASENIAAGSSAYCLGKDTYNDGKGAFYKIRATEPGDDPDGYNLVTITDVADTVAERLPNYEINQINNTLSTLTTTTIPGIEGDITTINDTTIPTIQGSINTINNTSIPYLQGQIDTINETTIPGVTATVTAEKNARIADNKTITSLVVISDSYGVMDGTTNFPNAMKNQLGLDNDHFYNNSYGGTGFVHATDSKTFGTLVSECATNLSVERRAAVTHVLIAGGYNDQWSSDSDIVTACTTCINNAQNVFPNAKIYVAHIGWSTNDSNLQKTFDCYYTGTAASKFGKFIINSQNILRGDLISADNVHPNGDGTAYLAKNLIQGLQTGACYPMSWFQYLDDTNSNHLGVVQCNNNICSFEMYTREWTYSGTANGTEYTYCTLKAGSLISGHNNCRITVPVMLVNESTGKYTMGSALIKISQRVVKVALQGLLPDGTNYFTFTSVRFFDGCYLIDHKYI